MEEEKKVYSIIGTVTIGTDEYRDLIEAKMEAEKKYEKQSDDWYKIYREKSKVEEENKKLREELDKYKNFLKKNTIKFGEESVAVFMQMLGED